MGIGRELVWRKEGWFEGWVCTVCSWVRLHPRLIGNTETPSRDVGEAFDAHVCAKYLHPKHRKHTPFPFSLGAVNGTKP